MLKKLKHDYGKDERELVKTVADTCVSAYGPQGACGVAENMPEGC